MKNRNSKKENRKEIVYSIRYDSLNSESNSSNAHPLLARKSQYQLREASDRYLFQVARIFRRERFKEDERMDIQFSFLRKKK